MSEVGKLIGVDVSSQTAGAVKIQSSIRAMKTYTITESELWNIALSNAGSAFCFAIMSALVVYGFDIAKDSALAGSNANATITFLRETVRPACFIAAAIFAVSGVALVFWRSEMIRMIKGESSLTR